MRAEARYEARQPSNRGQAGGAGGSGPGGVAGAVLWLKGDAIVGTDGVGITTWPDSSGGGLDATQPTSARRPLYVASYAPLSSKPAALFTPASFNWFALPALGGSGDWTVIIAGDFNSANDGQYVLDVQTPRHIVNLQHSIVGTNGPSAYYDGSWHDVGSNFATGPGVYSWVLANGAGTASIWKNGASLGTGTYASDAFSGADVTFGGAYTRSAAVVDGYVDGRVAELAVYHSALSTSNRHAIEVYLGAKYGITIF